MSKEMPPGKPRQPARNLSNKDLGKILERAGDHTLGDVPKNNDQTRGIDGLPERLSAVNKDTVRRNQEVTANLQKTRGELEEALQEKAAKGKLTVVPPIQDEGRVPSHKFRLGRQNIPDEERKETAKKLKEIASEPFFRELWKRLYPDTIPTSEEDSKTRRDPDK